MKHKHYWMGIPLLIMIVSVLIAIGAGPLSAASEIITLDPGDDVTVECPTELESDGEGSTVVLRCTEEDGAPSSDDGEPTATPDDEEPTTTPDDEEPTTTPDDEDPGNREVPVAGEECPAWVHDQYVTTGPDGNEYRTWHPPVDEEYGCYFGHEHGADPRTSNADDSMPAFGYAAAQIGLTEPHEGFKVFVVNAGDEMENKRAIADYRVVFHMGTSNIKRYTVRFHSLEYDYVARDGSGRRAHIYGMSDTKDDDTPGSTCDKPRTGGRDFSTIGCDDPYEIWGFNFSIIHPDDQYTGEQQVRTFVSGAAAVFDPITTRDPDDINRLVYSQDYYRGDEGIDPTSPEAYFQGCRREMYGGPNYWNNADRPTVYYTDAYGNVQDGPGPNLIKQEVSASQSRSNELFKYREDFCGNGIHTPN